MCETIIELIRKYEDVIHRAEDAISSNSTQDLIYSMNLCFPTSHFLTKTKYT